MKLDAKALAFSLGLIAGGFFLVVGLANMAFTGYGDLVLELAADFYPGYGGPDGVGALAVVTAYGLVDGAIAGVLVAWLYNLVAPGRQAA